MSLLECFGWAIAIYVAGAVVFAFIGVMLILFEEEE